MDPGTQQIEIQLRKGDARGALRTAYDYIQSSPRESEEKGTQIARALSEAYRAFAVDPVHSFVDHMGNSLPGDVADVIDRAMGPQIGLTYEWEGKVRACFEERLARELRDFVRNKQWGPTLQNIEALCHSSSADQEELERRVTYVGNVLGTCLNHPREADYIIAMLSKDPDMCGLTNSTIQLMKEAKDYRHSQMMSAALDNIENQWTNTLRATEVDILNALPARNLMGDPEPEEQRQVGEMMRAILRAPLSHHEMPMFVDATLLLVDFTPKELAYAAQASGIEGRSYSQLGYRARIAVARAFMEIGKSSEFANIYLNWGEDQLDTPYADQVVEFMGALRSEAFAPLLMKIWKNKKFNHLRPELATALGNLASPEAADALLEELEEVINKRTGSINQMKSAKGIMDPTRLRQARRFLSGLGRIIRSPRTHDDTRKVIVRRVIEMIPEDNREISHAAVMEVVSLRPGDLTAQQRNWVIDQLVDTLWVQDQSTGMHRGEERPDSILGERQAMAQALIRMGQHEPEFVVSAMEPHASRYSGAYMAAAEVLSSLKDARAVRLLGQMILNAMMFDEGRQTAYSKETYWDPTDEERKDLTKDRVVAEMVDSLGKMEASEAKVFLRQLLQRIRTGRMKSPGDSTMLALSRHLGVPERSGDGGRPGPVTDVLDAVRDEEEDEEEAGAGGLAALPAFAPAESPGGMGDDRAEEKLPEADPAEVRKLIKAVRSSHRLKKGAKRAQAKITALVRLGQLTPMEAIDPVFENLKDKDPMIVSAAITTLSEYGGLDKPRFMVDTVVEKALECFQSKDATMRAAAPKLLLEIGPNRREIRTRIGDFIRSQATMEVGNRLKRILQMTQSDIGEEILHAAEEPDSGSGMGAAVGAATDHTSLLEKRQQYMAARRAWIEGGKKGDPPEPPPGL